MAKTFSFSSKLRVFGQAAQLTFSSVSKGNYDGIITFYGEGLAIDPVIQNLWKKVSKNINCSTNLCINFYFTAFLLQLERYSHTKIMSSAKRRGRTISIVNTKAAITTFFSRNFYSSPCT